ncbi:hypothetical protein M7I_6571 [Glarea lozoyensis 74030]|uniref:Uncharacterized protein n=1 Tax=Glarea lozoyensis (strain ATCC 74030 / MF5533) TaxID=1104152 RepID=H0EUY1_GLAL7|nr:hypothetical protein M7I_6571 [Glarea lozoyensis 74030]
MASKTFAKTLYRQHWHQYMGTNSYGRRQPKAPKHKASVARFLTWVAYVRNQSPSASLNLKKCPLIG